MIKEEVKLPMNLQFFGDAAGTDTNTDTEGTAGTDTGAESKTGDQSQEKAGAKDTTTYTQEDLNRIGKQEKESGRKTALKTLGFEDEKTAKAELAAYKIWKDSQKTQEEKTAEQVAASTKEAQDAKNEAALLKNTLALVKAGVSIDSVDDVLALALPKVSETVTLEKAVEAMKKEAKYASLFSASAGNSAGTGSKIGSQGTGTGSGASGLGARLGQQANEAKSQKSSYFSH